MTNIKSVPKSDSRPNSLHIVNIYIYKIRTDKLMDAYPEVIYNFFWINVLCEEIYTSMYMIFFIKIYFRKGTVPQKTGLNIKNIKLLNRLENVYYFVYIAHRKKICFLSNFEPVSEVLLLSCLCCSNTANQVHVQVQVYVYVS